MYLTFNDGVPVVAERVVLVVVEGDGVSLLGEVIVELGGADEGLLEDDLVLDAVCKDGANGIVSENRKLVKEIQW